MTVTERSRAAVADALDRFDAAYGEFELVEKAWDHPPDAYDRVRERFAAGTLGGAGVWTTDDRGRVLLVRHEGDDAWSDPGGKQEPGERFEETARRETREETGVEVAISDVRQAHRVTIRPSESDRPPVHRLIVIFGGEYVSGETRPREGEIAEVRWWSERPEELLYAELAEFPFPASV